MAGSLWVGGDFGVKGYFALPAGVGVEVIPTLPVVARINYAHYFAANGDNSPDRFLDVGGGIKLSDEVGKEGHFVAVAAWQSRDTTYNSFVEMAAEARHYSVLRFGYLTDRFRVVSLAGSGTSSGFYVGYSVNTLLSAEGGLVGLKAVNSLMLDLLYGSVPAGAATQNKFGARAAWTTDYGNIFSVRFEGGLRPALGAYAFMSINLFLIQTLRL